jgi:preprotein translocase subunit YajC
MELLLFLLPLVVLALLMRQQQRRLRQHQALIASLDVGDEVVTTSGLFGTIIELDADIAMLEIAPGVTVKLAKRAIGGLVNPSEEEDEESDDEDTTEPGPVQDAS